MLMLPHFCCCCNKGSYPRGYALLPTPPAHRRAVPRVLRTAATATVYATRVSQGKRPIPKPLPLDARVASDVAVVAARSARNTAEIKTPLFPRPAPAPHKKPGGGQVFAAPQNTPRTTGGVCVPARKKGVLSSGYALLSTPPAHPKRRGNAGGVGGSSSCGTKCAQHCRDKDPFFCGSRKCAQTEQYVFPPAFFYGLHALPHPLWFFTEDAEQG
jgi:hypothetical protein